MSDLANPVNALSAFTPMEFEDIRSAGVKSAYCLFTHKLSNRFSEYQQKVAGLQSGDPIIVFPEGTVLPLKPFKFHLLTHQRFWLKKDADGNVVEATKEEPPRNSHDWAETIETVLIVHVEGGAYLARCSFQTTKTPCVKLAYKTLMEAKQQLESGTFEKMGPTAAVLKKLGDYRLFYTTTVIQIPVTSKSSGKVYLRADGEANLTTLEELAALNDLLKYDDFETQMQNVLADYQYRIDQLNARIGKK